MNQKRTYIAIDLKSFYASVECRERCLDPLTTYLVVADKSRTNKTICLAISPALKSLGVAGRPRLFEVEQKVKEINAKRFSVSPKRRWMASTCNANELHQHADYRLDYIVASPRMSLYIEYSKRVYEVYLKYVSAEDIHVYSIDEVFIDVTDYLNTIQMSAKEMAQMMIQEVMAQTGITATAGIGDNLYLCKVAMDIVAKHIPADENGVRIAQLDEIKYRKLLWDHQPLTDFWRVGRGIAKKLAAVGMYTMGDVARCSLNDEDLLYRLFGKNAELLIDHAWGIEPCTMKEIKSYRPTSNSIGSGQVLQEPYTKEKGRVIVKEMMELLSLDLVAKGLVSDSIVLTVGYDIENLDTYQGDTKIDFYGRRMPKPAHGTIHVSPKTSSSKLLMDAIVELYDQIVDSTLLIRRINMAVCNVVREASIKDQEYYDQLNLFENIDENQFIQEKQMLAKEKDVQKAILDIKHKYGKNAIIKGMNLLDGATTLLRNKQIGGHKA